MSDAKPDQPDLDLARYIVDRLGGPTKAAQFFEIKPPSISDWLKNGVPRARLRHLRDARPDVFPQPSTTPAAEVQHG